MSRAVAITLLLVACGEAPVQQLGAGPPEIDLFYRDVEWEWRPLLEGDTIPLLVGPAGGFFNMLALEARNLDASELTVETSVVDPASGMQLFEVQRKISADESIYLISCSAWNGPDLLAKPLSLSVTAADSSGNTASEALTISTSCSEPDFEDLCRCWCTGVHPEC